MFNKKEEKGKKLCRHIHRVCSNVGDGDASEVKWVEEGKRLVDHRAKTTILPRMVSTL